MPDDSQVLIFENSYSLTNYFIKEWMRMANTAIEKRHSFSAALSGGKTPVEFYCKLSNIKDFELWSATHIFLTDERFVSLEDKNNNFGMIKRNILDYVNILEDNIYPVDANQKNVQEAAAHYEQKLRCCFNVPFGKFPRFDLMLLGLGEDGHTASLFPGEKALDEKNKFVIASAPTHLAQERISLTFPVINNAREIVFIICGKNKAEMVQKILEDKDQSLPASRIHPTNGTMTYLLDKDAASALSSDTTFTHLDEAIVRIRS